MLTVSGCLDGVNVTRRIKMCATSRQKVAVIRLKPRQHSSIALLQLLYCIGTASLYIICWSDNTIFACQTYPRL